MWDADECTAGKLRGKGDGGTEGVWVFFIFYDFFFLTWTIFFKSLLNLLQYYFCFIFWLFGPQACGILAL